MSPLSLPLHLAFLGRIHTLQTERERISGRRGEMELVQRINCTVCFLCLGPRGECGVRAGACEAVQKDAPRLVGIGSVKGKDNTRQCEYTLGEYTLYLYLGNFY